MIDGGIFLSWVEHHGRSVGIAEKIGLRAVFIGGGKGALPLRYLRQWVRTTRALKALKPSRIVLMQPPVVALWAVLPYVRRHRVKLVGDLHTGTFTDPKWSWATKSALRQFGRHGFAIVTNPHLAEVAESSGCTALVLHNVIEIAEPSGSAFEDPALEALTEAPYILVPLAYANDEPLNEILAAAEAQSEIPFILTGRPPAWFRAKAGSNVIFSGFVSSADYLKLVERARAVAALTTRADTMQQAGYEAVSAAKALLTINTLVLVEYFTSGAILVEPTAGGIAAGASEVMAAADSLSDQMKALRDDKLAEQVSQLSELEQMLRN